MRRHFDVPEDVARRAYKLYKLNHWSPQKVATWLNEEGVPGPSRRRAWGQEAVRRFIIAPRERVVQEPLNESTALAKPIKVARDKL